MKEPTVALTGVRSSFFLKCSCNDWVVPFFCGYTTVALDINVEQRVEIKKIEACFMAWKFITEPALIYTLVPNR